jgi:predicted  nucleic acid-binding Zn-ribbon protein
MAWKCRECGHYLTAREAAIENKCGSCGSRLIDYEDLEWRD